METQKQNVAEFNRDVAVNGGYKYTTNAPYSSVVANERMTQAIIAAIPKGARSIIDIGCGDGTYTEALAKNFPGMEVIGLDPATDAIARAQKLIPSAKFISGDLLAPESLPKVVYDVGVIRGVIHHLPNGSMGFANAARICKTLIVVEPNGNNPVLKWIEKHSAYHIAHQEQSFTDRLLAKWGESAGFRKIEVSYIGFIPFFFPTLPAKVIHVFQPVLERIFPVNKYLAAQIVLTCSNFEN